MIRSMQSSRRKKIKIFNVIVSSVFVYVVNYFGRIKFSTKKFFNNMSVLHYISRTVCRLVTVDTNSVILLLASSFYNIKISRFIKAWHRAKLWHFILILIPLYIEFFFASFALNVYSFFMIVKTFLRTKFTTSLFIKDRFYNIKCGSAFFTLTRNLLTIVAFTRTVYALPLLYLGRWNMKQGITSFANSFNHTLIIHLNRMHTRLFYGFTLDGVPYSELLKKQ